MIDPSKLPMFASNTSADNKSGKDMYFDAGSVEAGTHVDDPPTFHTDNKSEKKMYFRSILWL